LPDIIDPSDSFITENPYPDQVESPRNTFTVMKSSPYLLKNESYIIKHRTKKDVSLSSPRVRFVHESNLPGDSRPFEFAFQRPVSLLLLELFPFEKLVCKTKMWLDDDVQSSGTDEAAAHKSEISRVLTKRLQEQKTVRRLTMLLGMRDP
jgi:hypothetical protein